GTPAALKTLGDHPDGGPITVRDGKYGPYVNWAKVNATLPKGKAADSVTLEEALVLIAEKAGKAPAKGKAKATKTTKAAKSGDAKAAKPKATAKPKAASKAKKA
ncbi:MAG TPA: topoisomerase C-terminal repeat-containing protein, partial [Shinella sp.]|nr:topoisomerase C-terminal repeat-containing protein [Shinella sp.]